MLAPFQIFVSLLLFFHTSEFALAAAFNRSTLSWRSWLLSAPYVAAMLAACAEHAAELRYAPWIKAWQVTACGVALAVVGEVVRKAGLLTARRNFTHKIQYQRLEGHVLVTHGIYSWVRHPGYLGWVVWAVATQLVLCNPVCTLMFAAVAWRFMRDRIETEDALLLKFFGAEWQRWRLVVPSGLPGIP